MQQTGLVPGGFIPSLSRMECGTLDAACPGFTPGGFIPSLSRMECGTLDAACPGFTPGGRWSRLLRRINLLRIPTILMLFMIHPISISAHHVVLHDLVVAQNVNGCQVGA